MENVPDTDTYEATVTLIKDDATYIKYHIEIESDNAWYKYDVTDFYLKNETSNGGNGNGTNGNNNNGNGNDESPGFELVTLLIAMSLVGVNTSKVSLSRWPVPAD